MVCLPLSPPPLCTYTHSNIQTSVPGYNPPDFVTEETKHRPPPNPGTKQLLKPDSFACTLTETPFVTLQPRENLAALFDDVSFGLMSERDTATLRFAK